MGIIATQELKSTRRDEVRLQQENTVVSGQEMLSTSLQQRGARMSTYSGKHVVNAEKRRVSFVNEEMQRKAREERVLKFIFHCCDADGDGGMTSIDLKKTCVNYPEISGFLDIKAKENIRQVRDIFKQMDEDGNGAVSWEEFLSFFSNHRDTMEAKLREVSHETCLRLVFERLSTKRSNTVPIKEIIAACEQDECISDMLCLPEHGLERSQMVEQLFNTLRELNSGRGSENLQRHISFQDMK